MKKIRLLFFLILLSCLNIQAQSWQEQNTGLKKSDGYISLISIVDANTVWCSTSAPDTSLVFSRTTNGSITWKPGRIRPLPINAGTTGIFALDSLTAFACFVKQGSGGLVYKTNNGGTTWKPLGAGKIFTNSQSFPDKIHFWDASNGIVIGDPVNGFNEIYTTSNGGDSWTPLPSVNIPPNDSVTSFNIGVFILDSTIWFSTWGGDVFKSINLGANWLKFKVESTAQLGDICFLDDKLHGLTLSSAGKLYQSSDGGSSWKLFSPIGGGIWNVSKTIRNIPGTGYFICADRENISGNSFISLDTGKSWTEINSLIFCNGMVFKDINTGYAGGRSQASGKGGIYKWNPTSTGIIQPLMKNKLTLYPNPAYEKVSIDFGNLQGEKEVIITDISGKTVFKSITYENYKMEINVNEFINGVYTIQIKSTHFLEIKKLILSR